MGQPEKVVAIVLAGGLSRRMGQDKALISINGVGLLHRTCEIALQCAGFVWVVTPRVEAYRSQVPPACKFIQERSLAGESFPHGPLLGFAQGLAQIQREQNPEDLAEWVLLLACDLPALQANILQNWLGQLGEQNPATALLPVGAKGWEPLCGFYRMSCLPSLQAFIQQGGRSLQAWLAREQVNAIAFSPEPAEQQRERAMLFNCNTPEDLRIINNL